MTQMEILQDIKRSSYDTNTRMFHNRAKYRRRQQVDPLDVSVSNNDTSFNAAPMILNKSSLS